MTDPQEPENTAQTPPPEKKVLTSDDPGFYDLNSKATIPKFVPDGSHDPTNPHGLSWQSHPPWELGSRKDQLTKTLRTVSIRNVHFWMELATIFRSEKDLLRAEICYIGARYNNLADHGLAMRWLEVFVANRASIQSKEQIHEEAQMMNAGLELVANKTERLHHELQTLLWTLERDDILARAGTPIDVQFVPTPI